MWPRYVIIITNSLEKEQIKVLGKYYCVAFLGQNHLQLIAKLVLILANQNARILTIPNTYLKTTTIPIPTYIDHNWL